MLPASAWPPECRSSRHGHIGLGQRRSVVGAVAGHGDQMPLGLVAADGRKLAGRGLGNKSRQSPASAMAAP